MSELGLGIIGFGRIGALHHQRSSSAGLRPVAACDPTAARRELAARRGIRAYEHIGELLNETAIDAVVVATPTSMHFEQASAALSAGKHVMIEKPMTLDLPQAQQLVQLARDRRLVLSVFHNRRWDADYLTLKSAIDRGTFGHVFNVESRLGQWASCVGPAAKEWRPQWRNESAFGGGGLYDWGSHFLDQIWRLMLPARPVRVFAQLRGNVWTRDCDDLARVCIDFDNEAVAMVEINTTTARPLPRWHVDGTLGSADSPHSLTFDTNVWSRLEFSPADGSERHVLPRIEPELDAVGMWGRFAAAVRGQGDPAVPASSVLPTMALLDAARQSSANGAAVKVDPMDMSS